MGNYPYVLGLSKQKRRKAIGAVIKRRSKHRNPAVLNIRRPATSAARMTGHRTGKTKKRGKNKKGGSMTRASRANQHRLCGQAAPAVPRYELFSASSL